MLAELNVDAWKLVEQLRSIKAQKKWLEQQEKMTVEALRGLTDGEPILVWQGKTVATDKEVVSRRFDSKQFREVLPEVFEQYVVESRSRVFRLVD